MNNICRHCGEETDQYLETECVECYVNGLISDMGLTEETDILTVI
jgi:hypothetical protein